jgi:DNA-directed RNA polymerase beta' subunit
VQTHGGEVQGDTRQAFRPEDARAILEKICDEDLKLMGMDPRQSRPEWMVIKVLAVAPPPVRPSVEAGDGVRSEDDLTYAYREIVKMNKELKNRMDSGQPRGTQDEVLKALQLHVATLMDNNLADCPQQRHTGGRPLKDIRSRLKGKEGRVRGNLMGKRVDFSARTVITPDPILQLD